MMNNSNSLKNIDYHKNDVHLFHMLYCFIQWLYIDIHYEHSKIVDGNITVICFHLSMQM